MRVHLLGLILLSLLLGCGPSTSVSAAPPAVVETVSQLTVPTDDRAVLTKGLDIVRDWAADVTFDPVEVDKERGVVLEEWRLGRGAGARIEDKQFPVIFQGSRYAQRLPIGLPEVLKTAKRDTRY